VDGCNVNYPAITVILRRCNSAGGDWYWVWRNRATKEFGDDYGNAFLFHQGPPISFGSLSVGTFVAQF
jgi:hypothetical protein